MRPTVVTVTGVGTSAVIPVDYYVSPTSIGLGCTLTGTATYSVQYTFDDVFASGYNPATGNWVDHPSLTAKTASADSNLAYPARGVRLNVTAGTGSVRLVFIQAGDGGLGS